MRYLSSRDCNGDWSTSARVSDVDEWNWIKEFVWMLEWAGFLTVRSPGRGHRQLRGVCCIQKCTTESTASEKLHHWDGATCKAGKHHNSAQGQSTFLSRLKDMQMLYRFVVILLLSHGSWLGFVANGLLDPISSSSRKDCCDLTDQCYLPNCKIQWEVLYLRHSFLKYTSLHFLQVCLVIAVINVKVWSNDYYS